MWDFISFYLTQVLMTVGAIILFGFLIGLCNKQFYANLGNLGRPVCYITGFFGTPVHECAHALFCLIFGHKITEMKLFQVSDDGTLGYVCHSYNPKNFYHRIGNFFIGVAPIPVISALLWLLSYFMVPEMFNAVTFQINQFDVTDGFTEVLKSIIDICGAVFSQAGNYMWWIFVFVGAFFALHMTLSQADIKGALAGILFILGLLLVVDIILYIIGLNVIIVFTHAITRVGGYLIGTLSLALLISLIALGVSFIIKLISGKIRRA